MIHFDDLLFFGSSHDFNDLNELINLGISQKGWLSIDHFYQDASCGPDINLASVISGPKNQLRCTIAPRTYVRKIGFT